MKILDRLMRHLCDDCRDGIHRQQLLQVLEDKMLVGDGCWEWTGTISDEGYGTVYHRGKNRKAHRVVYELFEGEVPEGLVLDHVCHDPARCANGLECAHRRCVRPDHLEPVEHGVNIRRGARAKANRRHG